MRRSKTLKAKPPVERGVVATRRLISPESYPMFSAIGDSLAPELVNSGRLFEVRSLGVTVVGFSRLTKRHRAEGPPTNEITAQVLSTHDILQLRIGKIGIFGSGNKHKLGFPLYSAELIAEVEALEVAYADRGFRLGTDPNNDQGQANPHCSFALLYNDHIGHFQDERTLAKLQQVCSDATDLSQPVYLMGVNEPAQTPMSA